MKKNQNIPVVILCGGKGTRAGQLTAKIPKPLIRIGEKPILWHVMKIYSQHGFSDFILCLGYKSKFIRNYFKKNNKEKWNITCVDTGIDSLKSARLFKVEHLIKSENFFLAYGDDLADIEIQKLLKQHLLTKKVVTTTAVRTMSDFGVLKIGKGKLITDFKEKPPINQWINGGFMVLNKRIFRFLRHGELESDVFRKLVKLKQIAAYKHSGKWKAMNTIKDSIELNLLWEKGQAFWKTW
jgi:glucose-1-phosphate cytidylyltransferase